MSPAERALVVAIGEVLDRIHPDLHLKQMISLVKAEDERRALHERMPEMSKEARQKRERY